MSHEDRDHPALTAPKPRPARSHRAYGIGGVLLGAAAAVLVVVAVNTASGGDTSKQSGSALAKRVFVSVPVSTPVQPVVDLSVSPAIKPGPDGQLHDAFSVTDFSVRVGQPVRLVINNTDTMDHSITSPAAGVNIIARPGQHAYTLLVTKPGRFEWHCIFPCDPWSMQRVGYMRGYITAS